MVCVEALVVHIELVDRLVAAQVVLGQQGALVGALGLLADQHNPSGEALGPQGLGGLAPARLAPTMINVCSWAMRHLRALGVSVFPINLR